MLIFIKESSLSEMAEIINGKTINQLIQIEDITGNEIIPLSVKNEETGKYVTRSITLNNMLKLIVDAIKHTNGRLTEAENDLNNKIVTATSELNDSLNSKIDKTNMKFSGDIENLKAEDIKINEQLSYTVAYTSYNASAIVRLGTYMHDMSSKVNDTSSYLTYMSNNLSELVSYTSYLSSYTNAAFASNDEVDKKQQEEINTNSYINSYQENNITQLTYIHANPWEISE